MIKLVTGSPYPSRATSALVNLCNAFNQHDIPSILYTSNLSLQQCCNLASLSQFKPESGDTIVLHHVPLKTTNELAEIVGTLANTQKANSLKKIGHKTISLLPATPPKTFTLILSIMEQTSPTERNSRLGLFHKIHLSQKSPSITDKQFICPSLITPLTPTSCKQKNIAGIMDNIQTQNCIEKTIQQALQDGMEKIILFGALTEPNYFYEQITPLQKAHPGKIQYAGYTHHIQNMYNSINHAYVHSIEWADTIAEECRLTHVTYHGPSIENIRYPNNELILSTWKTELSI